MIPLICSCKTSKVEVSRIQFINNYCIDAQQLAQQNVQTINSPVSSPTEDADDETDDAMNVEQMLRRNRFVSKMIKTHTGIGGN